MTIKHAKYNSVPEALEAMKRYCAIQDRCQMDIRTKLINGGIYGQQLESIIAELISDQFIDESRYAKAYVSGKYKINKWGTFKIIQGLKQKDISEYCIEKGLAEIDKDIYRSNLDHVIGSKLNELKNQRNDLVKRTKVLRFCINKGYETELINKQLDLLLKK